MTDPWRRRVEIGEATIYTGNCLEVLRSLPDESVHCIVTSPPYWGLRDYGLPPSVWDGELGCAHEWGDTVLSGGQAGGTNQGSKADRPDGCTYRPSAPSASTFCRLCGAWRGAHGLEPTPELYVQHEVQIWREARRVLRADGTAWINLGDSYAGTISGYVSIDGDYSSRNIRKREAAVTLLNRAKIIGLKPKDLVGIPWRVAFALQADGWYLRSDIIWAKPNPMPESVTDRPTKAHEYVFMLSKSARYFYDAEAVREESIGGEWNSAKGFTGSGRRGAEPFFQGQFNGPRTHPDYNQTGRNRRSVWTIATAPFKGAHFATFPPALVKPCILAGCPEHVCPKCGAPWVREVELGRVTSRGGSESGQRPSGNPTTDFKGGSMNCGEFVAHEHLTIGTHPTCACGLPAIPGTVLDPFGGSGTTAEVALEYGRRAILIELNPKYVELAEERLRPVAGRPLLAFGGTA